MFTNSQSNTVLTNQSQQYKLVILYKDSNRNGPMLLQLAILVNIKPVAYIHTLLYVLQKV